MHFCPRNLVFVLLILLCMAGAYFLYIEIHEANSVVAIINGAKIFYKDIKADPKFVQPDKVHKYEAKRLAGKIHEVIFKQKIAELGLTVSEEEVHSRVDEIFEKAGMTGKKAQAVCESTRAAYEALVAWQKNSAKEDTIYNEKLADSLISKEQWKAYQACYDTPEKLKRFLVPNNIEDMKKNSRESSKRDLFYKKLKDVITGDVSVRNEEIEDAYQEKYGHLLEKPTLEKVRDKLHSQLLTKKKQEAEKLWWQEQYRQARIEIKDTRFKDIRNILWNPG